MHACTCIHYIPYIHVCIHYITVHNVRVCIQEVEPNFNDSIFCRRTFSLAPGLKGSMFPLRNRFIFSNVGGHMNTTKGLSIESRRTFKV